MMPDIFCPSLLQVPPTTSKNTAALTPPRDNLYLLPFLSPDHNYEVGSAAQSNECRRQEELTQRSWYS